MPRKRKNPGSEAGTFDADQVVAYNFRLAREEKGWTQDQTAERLEPFLGNKLKKASISTIERSVDSDRRRVFTAQDLVAFALAFDKPIIWFFVPPRPASADEPAQLRAAGTPLVDLVPLLFGRADQMDDLKSRFARLTTPVTSGEDAETPEQIAATEELLGEAAKVGYGFNDQATWEHYAAFRRDALQDILPEEHSELEAVFVEMTRLTDLYAKVKKRMALSSDTPRQTYRHVSEVVLGEHIFEVLSNDYQDDMKAFDHDALLTVAEQDQVPWEDLIDTDDPTVRDAIQNLGRAIRPKVVEYLGGTGG